MYFDLGIARITGKKLSGDRGYRMATSLEIKPKPDSVISRSLLYDR